jgi:DNA polymerase
MPIMSGNSERMRQIAIQRLECLQQAGVMQLPKMRASGNRGSRMTAAAAPTAVEPATIPVRKASVDAAASSDLKKRAWKSSSLFTDECDAAAGAATAGLTLEVLQQQVASCTRCDELAQARTQTVFGVGNPAARLCFLGEAPGADEDRLGEPFVGRAGQLLTKIIEACKLKRDDVYILNMIKCRPPGNRNPLPTELANCRGYLEQQLDLIKPEYICCLGAVAAQNLLSTPVSIGKLRGKIHSYRGAKVVCTYHPAFLLRSPAFKKETWQDMKMLMREMGVELG